MEQQRDKFHKTLEPQQQPTFMRQATQQLAALGLQADPRFPTYYSAEPQLEAQLMQQAAAETGSQGVAPHQYYSPPMGSQQQ